MKSLVKLLKITLAQSDKETLNEEINNKLFDHIMGGIESVSGKFGHYYIGVRPSVKMGSSPPLFCLICEIENIITFLTLR
jgi:hypothetical protein